MGLKFEYFICAGYELDWRNQTKVGLKYPLNMAYETFYKKKSDQGGIEIEILDKVIRSYIMKKSDQGGIEIKEYELRSVRDGREEIRPRWDWNWWSSFCSSLSVSSRRNQTKVGLKYDEGKVVFIAYMLKKSDQGGIEIG